MLECLTEIGNVSVGEPNRIGQSRREALQLAREDGAERLFYCDFDRWLHWADRFPDELQGLPGTIVRHDPDAWYVCLGRSSRAFATHPRVQRETEALSNRVISLLTGKKVDATAGSCWLTAPAADLILADSVETSNATDLEWPALIARSGPGRLSSFRVEGLEFETATFYRQEICAAGGFDTWVAQNYEGQETREIRQQLMTQSMRAALRVYGSKAMNALSCDQRALVGPTVDTIWCHGGRESSQ